MAKARIKFREMKDAKVDFVSIVAAGANRIPFKILKSQDGGKAMLNLNRIFKSETEAAGPSALVGVVIRKAAATDALREQLKKSGLATDKTGTLDDAVAFWQRDDGQEVLKSDVLVQVTPDVVAVVRNVSKQFTGFEATTGFGAEARKAGFFPGLEAATTQLRETIYRSMTDPKDLKQVRKQVENVIADFSDYLTEMVAALPAEAFQLDGGLAGLVTKAESKAPAEGAEKPADENAEKPAEGEGDEKTEETPDAVQKGILDALTALKDGIAELRTEVAAVKTSSEASIDELRGGLSTLRSETDRALKSAAQARKQANRVIFGSAQPPDPERENRVQKSTEPPYIDTGMAALR